MCGGVTLAARHAKYMKTLREAKPLTKRQKLLAEVERLARDAVRKHEEKYHSPPYSDSPMVLID